MGVRCIPFLSFSVSFDSLFYSLSYPLSLAIFCLSIIHLLFYYLVYSFPIHISINLSYNFFAPVLYNTLIILTSISCACLKLKPQYKLWLTCYSIKKNVLTFAHSFDMLILRYLTTEYHPGQRG